MDDEPPASQQSCESGLVKIVKDHKEITLLPNKSKGEIAVCNPASYGKHFIYRVRERWNNKYGERSVVKKDGKTILFPEHEWEKDGIEDARISRNPKNGQYYITYTAYNEDKKKGGAKVALATTEDFKEIHKHGIIGPQIRLEEGIELTGGKNSYYGSMFYREFQEERKNSPNSNPFIMDKDATIVYSSEGKSILLHRIGDSIQATPFDSIKQLQTQEFWKDTFGKLKDQTILYPGEKWASEKVGLGGTPININDRIIGHIHGVKRKNTGTLTEYTYNSTFAEFSPDTYEIISIIRDPLLSPNPDFVFIEESEKETIKKYINFATAMTVTSNMISNFSGVGDYAIEKRTTSKNYQLAELKKRHNLIQNWNRTTQH